MNTHQPEKLRDFSDQVDVQRIIWRLTVRHYDLSVQCALGIGCFDSLLSEHSVEEREFGTVKCRAGTLGDRVL